MAKSEFKSLQDLFTDSFEIFKDRLKRYFGLVGMSVLGFFLYFLFLILMMVISLGIGIGSVNKFDSFEQFLTNFDFTKLGVAGIVFVILTLGLIAFAMVVSMANILLVEDKKSRSIELIKKALPLVIPMFLTGILSGFLVMGGVFALIIPGVIIGMFLSYVSFEIVLGGKRGMEAIKSSMNIVSQNFWDIAWRYFLIWMIMVALNFVLGFGRNMDGSLMAIPFALLRLTYSLLSPFFFMIMGVLIYKEAKKRTDVKKEKNFTWVYIVSVLGWVIMIALVVTFGSLAVRNFGNVDLEEILESQENTKYDFAEFEEAMGELEDAMGEVDMEVDTEVNYENYISE